jgi:peptidoglycan hydrolase CwlO-like protein
MPEEPYSQTSKLLAALATAWILAGTSGAAWVAFNSIHDISGNQSDIRSLNEHLHATDQRVADLENRMDTANQKQDSTLDHLLENQGVCSSLVGRVTRLETRCDNLDVSDKQRRR